MSKTVCMIPARGSSKRIPGKNIKPFLGKPIITYPIETAKASGTFDDIYVYTDDDEIGNLALDNKVNWMPRNNVTDTETLTEAVMKFIRGEWPKYNCMQIDYLCVLLPTAVFIDEEIIKNGLSFACKSNYIYDCAITFCKYPHPIQRAFIFNYDSELRMREPEHMFTRTQDIDDSFYDAGQMYFLQVESFLKQKKIFMDNIFPYVIDAVDIDNPEDWKKAESYYKILKES